MMQENEYKESMKLVSSYIGSFLKPCGFKKKGSTFNKWSEDGLCQVINLQAGQSSLLGQFTVNLGIFVPELFAEKMKQEPAAFISEPYCAFRARLSEFVDEDDRWWHLTSNPEPEVSEIIELLQTYGLPFLSRFSNRNVILNELISFNERHCVTFRLKLDLAIIMEHTGDHEAAQKMFDLHLKEANFHKSHIEYLRTLAEKYSWTIDE